MLNYNHFMNTNCLRNHALYVGASYPFLSFNGLWRMQERIKVLESQLTRLKTRLAASTGDEDLMSFLFRDHTEELATYVEDLQKRLM